MSYKNNDFYYRTLTFFFANAVWFHINRALLFILEQKNFIQEKQTGHHYSMTVYHPQEVKIFPASNQPSQTIPVALSRPVFQSHIDSTVKNVVPSTVKPQSFGGLPIISSMPAFPFNGSIVGTTDLRYLWHIFES